MHRSRSRLSSWTNATGILYYGMLVAAMTLSLWSLRVPGFEEDTLGLALAVWFVSASHCVYILAPCAFAKSKTGCAKKGVGRILAFAISLMFAIILAVANLPEKAAFRYSEKDMANVARVWMTMPPGTRSDKSSWIGVYRIRSIQRVENGVALYMTNVGSAQGLLFGNAWMYCPSSAPRAKTTAWIEYQLYEYPWYIWTYLAE